MEAVDVLLLLDLQYFLDYNDMMKIPFLKDHVWELNPDSTREWY